MTNTEDIAHRIVHRRAIEGISAVLLPFDEAGQIDSDSFTRHLTFTVEAGLTPAVNMDTGYVNLLTPGERRSVLAVTQSLLAGRSFVAGAFIEGETGDPLTLYLREVATIQAHGGTPILFQCSALKHMTEAEIAALYRAVAAQCSRLLAFELGEMFAPFGQIYSLTLVRELMQIPQLVGMKHSSLRRELEWQRLTLRDELRPDFKLYTGDDLAIDMVMYGSDYLLGLSTFAPDAFALRDRQWAAGDAAFYELNDLIQYLGFFAFRPPVPAYKHSAAQFLKLRGLIACDQPHPQSPRRPDSDIAVLRDIVERLEATRR
ncbi:MAG TPA: dihydrodipicolinate synthase family protein [Anaerolineales bacterium]|nr:dihydrodipicolinate synthase family protein [Anaerolineales bacterium]